jgi:hypothetical protein
VAGWLGLGCGIGMLAVTRDGVVTAWTSTHFPNTLFSRSRVSSS